MECNHTDVEIKTFSQLLDEFVTVSQKIWHLVDKVNGGDTSTEVAQTVQHLNTRRHELMRSLDRRMNQADLGPKVFNEQPSS